MCYFGGGGLGLNRSRKYCSPSPPIEPRREGDVQYSLRSCVRAATATSNLVVSGVCPSWEDEWSKMDGGSCVAMMYREMCSSREVLQGSHSWDRSTKTSRGGWDREKHTTLFKGFTKSNTLQPFCHRITCLMFSVVKNTAPS